MSATMPPRSSWMQADPARPVVFQEPNPERARTHRSTAEAFREFPYTAAIQRWPAPRRLWRIVDVACWLAALALLTAPWWWPR